MSDVSELVRRMQAKILSQYASTVQVTENVTTISTPLAGFEVNTTISEYAQDELDESLKLAGVLGGWNFVSQLGVFYEESLEAYRLLTDTFSDTTTGQVWAKREGSPEGYIRIGMSVGMQITESQNGMSDEALMSTFYAFANDTHGLLEFANNNLKAFVEESIEEGK